MSQTKQQIIQENTKLQAQISALAWDSAYGCYSRAGIEHVIWPQICESVEAIISFDIDDMHGLNSRHGQAVMDAKIRKSLKLRKTDFTLIARIKSGDEGAVFVTRTRDRKATDLESMRDRLVQSFAKNGMMITAAIYRTRGCDFDKNIQAAFRKVEKLKKSRKLKGRK